MYSNLQDMNLYTDKVEKNSVINTTKMFKKAIER